MLSLPVALLQPLPQVKEREKIKEWAYNEQTPKLTQRTCSSFSSKTQTADAWCTKGPSLALGKLTSREACGVVGQPTHRHASSNLLPQLRTQKLQNTNAGGKIKGKLQLFSDHKNNDV